MSAEMVRQEAENLVILISDGQYDTVLKQCSSSRLTREGIESIIQSYGRNFIRPPENYKECVDLMPIGDESAAAWSVQAPLWTLEEGRSDLTLELTIFKNTEGATIELDDLRVL